MTIAKKKFTKKEVLAELRAIIREKPDSANPVVNGACMYHKGRGRNIKRCLVGELGYRLGLPTPRPSEGSSWTLTCGTGRWAHRFTDAARELLLAAQQAADAPAGPAVVGVPTRWGDIKVSALV